MTDTPNPDPLFYRDPDRLREEVEKYVTMAAAADAHGVSAATVQRWWQRHGLPPFKPGPRAGPQAHVKVGVPKARPDDVKLLEAMKGLGDEATIEMIADAGDMSPRRAREAGARLIAMGYRFDVTETAIRMERFPTVTGTVHTIGEDYFDGDIFRFGVTSDEHTSSIAETLDGWEAAYDVFEQEGITTVFSPGDVVDGLGIYRGQISEVKNHTYEEQVEHVSTVHPRRPGIVTKRIGGNHDLEGEFGRIGADPVQALANRRDDVEYLGRYSAWIDLPNGARIHILHPMGGASYATSYKPQKIVESYQLGEKPNILLIGHWHRHGYFFTRGVHTVLCGTFQGPTVYSVRKAFGEPALGFHIITCRIADDGSVVRFQPEWLPIFNGRVVR